MIQEVSKVPYLDERIVYVFVRQDVELKHQQVQMLHAMRLMTQRYTRVALEAQYFEKVEGEPFITLVGMPDEKAMNKLQAKLVTNHVEYVPFLDTDFDFGVVAIATQPMPLFVREKPDGLMCNYRLWNPANNTFKLDALDESLVNELPTVRLGVPKANAPVGGVAVVIPVEAQRILGDPKATQEDIDRAHAMRVEIPCDGQHAEGEDASLDRPSRPERVTLSGRAPELPEDSPAPAPINEATGQHRDYWVLSAEERAKGFIRPVRRSYKHLKCGTVTTMGQVIAETYARDPKFYGSTFCCGCGTHFALKADSGLPAFVWDGTDDKEGVGE